MKNKRLLFIIGYNRRYLSFGERVPVIFNTVRCIECTIVLNGIWMGEGLVDVGSPTHQIEFSMKHRSSKNY